MLGSKPKICIIKMENQLHGSPPSFFVSQILNLDLQQFSGQLIKKKTTMEHWRAMSNFHHYNVTLKLESVHCSKIQEILIIF